MLRFFRTVSVKNRNAVLNIINIITFVYTYSHKWMQRPDFQKIDVIQLNLINNRDFAIYNKPVDS